jgi:hypothetical protein
MVDKILSCNKVNRRSFQHIFVIKKKEIFCYNFHLVSSEWTKCDSSLALLLLVGCLAQAL